jgi:hypothetical protein
MSVDLTEALLRDAAGWEAMKMARAYLAQGQVLSSFWEPPLLGGVVQAGELSIRASMVIKSGMDIENLCTCRDSRQWGKICAHSVAVGLHWVNQGSRMQLQPPSDPSPACHPLPHPAKLPRSSAARTANLPGCS